MEDAVRTLVDALVSLLPQKLLCVWLYGSAVMGDFRLGWSDIDLLAFTEGELTEAEARELLHLRQRLAAEHPGNPFFRLFEGVLLPLPQWREKRYTRLVYWGTSGERITDRYGDDVFALWELAHRGRCVYGAGDRGLFPAPSKEELRAAVKAHYEGIRRCARETDESLYSCGWLLDMARCVYTLRNYQVIAKTRAGEWALRERIFPEPEALEQTLRIRRDPLSYRDKPEIRAWLKSLGPTVQRYADVLERELETANRRSGV